MERRFYIAVNDELPIHITESELKRRIKIAFEELYCELPNYNKAIDILLHGEKEK